MEKAELLEGLRTLTEAVEKSYKDDAQDAGEAVTDILDDTDVCCVYETVRKIVTAVTSYSDSTKMSFAKCLKEDGWTEESSNEPGLCLKVADLGVPMARQAEHLYSGLSKEQRELLFGFVVELIPLLLKDGDLPAEGIGDVVDESVLEDWASENGWKHPDHDSIDDFVEDMGGSEVRDFVISYIEGNL